MEKKYSNKRKNMNKCDTCSRKLICKESSKHKSVKECITYIDVEENKRYLNFVGILQYIIFVIGIIIISSVLISGCDNLRCYPEFDLNGEYIGIKCGGKF